MVQNVKNHTSFNQGCKTVKIEDRLVEIAIIDYHFGPYLNNLQFLVLYIL